MRSIKRWLARPSRQREHHRAENDTARSFESPTAEVLANDHQGTERATLYVLAVLIVALGAFVSLARVERAVSATGRLVPAAGALTVQPLQTQIISRILVSVGDVVHKGQLLATCDPTFARADRINLQQQVANLDAQVRRMEAENQGHPFAADRSKPYDVLQAQIFEQRRTEYRAGVGDFDQRINSTESQLAGLRESFAGYQSRLKIVEKMENMHSTLAQDGYVSKLQWLNIQDQQIDLRQKLSDAEASATSTEHLLQSLKEQRRVFVEKWRDDNLNALVAARNSLVTAQQDLTKADKVSELVDLVSPAEAVVTRIPVLTTGAVATGAQPLFSLVPLNAPLEAQVQIESKDIGFVKVGDPVILKFDTYQFLEHGFGKGVVRTVSQDSFIDETNPLPTSGNTTGQPHFFDARIGISELKLHDVAPGSHLIPGMTLSADIVVGERTILWYLVGGGLRSGAEALREP